MIEGLAMVGVEGRRRVPHEHGPGYYFLQLRGLLKYVIQRRLHRFRSSDQITLFWRPSMGTA